MRICYVPNRFTMKTRAVIDQVNTIVDEYQAQGFALTVRQLHYQFVARDWHKNTPTNYKRLISICASGRLGGAIDWDAIEDRTRELKTLPHWDGPTEILAAVAEQYRIDKWQDQPYRIEVWFEKAALAGIFDRVCSRLDVAYLATIGQNSVSEMHSGALRLRRYAEEGQECLILHFADHDPAGIEMTDTIKQKMAIYKCDVEVRRLALNMDQIRRYSPPPSFIKEKDKLMPKYVARFDTADAWELDALDPAVLTTLVEEEVRSILNKRAWQKSVKAEKSGRRLLGAVVERWDEVEDLLGA
jgi:hypothetical protein